MQYDFHVNIMIINIQCHTLRLRIFIMYKIQSLQLILRTCKGRYISQEKNLTLLLILLQIKVEKNHENITSSEYFIVYA